MILGTFVKENTIDLSPATTVFRTSIIVEETNYQRHILENLNPLDAFLTYILLLLGYISRYD